jgi:hypothetical protein
VPEVIRAIRSYPLTLLIAGFLFLCSLVLATASIGKIIGGGEDEGSGMGGTGKSGEFGGSGFGGTGGPNPFFGVTDEVPEDERATTDEPGNDQFNELELPSLLRSIDEILETAEIPRPMDTRSELSSTRPPAVPDDAYIGLDPITPAQQHLQDLADAAQQDVADTVIRIEVEIEDPTPRSSIAEQIEPFEMPQIAQEQESETTDETNGNNRASPERIQRPELPPFQRVRPVQGAAVPAPRPTPMRI